MSPGEIRGPVKTQFGYHVLKLDEVEAGHVRKLRGGARGTRSRVSQGRRRPFSTTNAEARRRAFASLTELESVAKSAEPAAQDGRRRFTREGGGELGPIRGVIEAAFSEDVLERRQNSPLVTVGEDRALVLRVTNHKPAEPRPLAEVRDQIVAQLRMQAAREAAAAKGAEAVARLQKGEAWNERLIASAASRPSASVSSPRRTPSLRRRSCRRLSPRRGPADLGSDKPHYAGVTTDDGNYAVIAVTQAARRRCRQRAAGRSH